MTKFSQALFTPLVGKIFSVRLNGGQTLELRLSNVRTGNISPRYESFTLDFDPPAGAPALPDDSYLMEAEGFGPEPIHLSATPGGTPDPNVHYYEAVFNIYTG